ncbi:MAG: restriction endonuclease subunit S [Bacteroidetes bacterium]|nr:restriction endonuclease subunit S [Bacteroidota bacterium]
MTGYKEMRQKILQSTNPKNPNSDNYPQMNEEQNINQLPKDWKWVKLGEYVEPVKGKKPKRVSTVKTQECPVPYINIKAFEKNIIDEYTDGVGCTMCEDGDFLMVWDGSRSGFVGKAIKGALGSTLVKLNFPDIENNYAYYFLQSKFLDINTRAKGVGIPQVDPAILWNYDLLIPPKPTQQAIVSKIEELFSELDKGIEQLKTAQQQLKTYRQAVLKWAFEGKLTNENVKDGELPEGWKWSTIGDVSKSVEYGSASKSKEQGKIPVLRMGNIQNGRFEWDDLVYTDDDDEINKYLLKKNDVLFNRTNSAELVGKTAIYKGEQPAIFAGYLIRINIIEKLINADYLNYYLNTKAAKQYGNSVRSFGVNQSNINGTKLKTYPLPLPPLEEQNQIVQEIESRLSVTDKMEENITQSLQQAAALRQSILKKAFEGRLI